VLATLLVSAPIAAFLAMALTRAGARGHEIPPALDAAWLAVATDVVQQHRGALDAQALAPRLGVEEPQAEELMALLDVNDVVAGSARGRVPVAAAAAAPGMTQLSSAEEEAALVEQAAAEGEARRQKGSV